ncbi:MAG: hypothetical protein ACR2IL_09690 [Chitinophagaceae bacterium]
MRRFIVKLGKWLLVCMGLLFVLGLLAEYRLYRNTRELYYSRQADWHLYHRRKHQILFIGNSRTSVHVDVNAAMQHFEVPAYSLCQDARHMEFFWYKFKKYIERNPLPKVIVLQADISSLLAVGFNMNTFYGKDKYLTYLFANQLGINHYFENEEGYKAYEAYIPLVRYIHYKDYFLAHWNRKFSDPYAPPHNSGAWLIDPTPVAKLKSLDLEVEQKRKLKKQDLSTFDFTFLDSFITFAQQHRIQFMAVYPPQSWASYATESRVAIDSITNYCKVRQVPYRNFNRSDYAADSLFFNHIHLNAIGAKRYTAELIQWMDSLGCKRKQEP